MSSDGSTVFENPQWEAARKALEAVSPQKKKESNSTDKANSNQGQENAEKPAQNDSTANGNEMSPHDLYYQQFSQFKQRQAMMMNRPPYVSWL